MKKLIISMLFCSLGFLVFAEANNQDVVIADFEGTSYGNWTVTGKAFGNAPAKGTLRGQQRVSGFSGKGLINSFINRDKSQGTITSPEFKISKKYINFLIGGGKHPGKTCINLIINNKVVRTTTGSNSEKMEWGDWDVSEFNGKTAKIQIVDKVSSGWGHILIDQIIASTGKR